MIKRRLEGDIITITTEDRWDLDSILYPARTGKNKDAVILHIHGKGATMLDIQARWLPEALPGISHFTFNMRCHSLAYNTDRDDVPVAGGMYESLPDGEFDLRAAVDFLRHEGFKKIVVCGHSSGGYYGGMFTPLGDDIVGRVLLSPLTDNKVALAWWYPEPGQLESALDNARHLVELGRPDEIIPLPSWYWGISARSLLQRAAQPGSEVWIQAVNAHPSPVLLGWGSTESRDSLWSEIFEEIVPEKEVLRLEGSDHWYHGYEDRVSSAVAQFVASTVGFDPR